MANPYTAPRRGVAPPAPLGGRRPRLLAHIHKYAGIHNAGAEWMLHSVLRGLRDRGWDVAVAGAHIRQAATIDGIDAVPASVGHLVKLYGWADTIVTHLDVTRAAVRWSRQTGRPIVHLLHNDRQLEYHRVRAGDADLLIANSEWIAEHYAARPEPMIVCRPPVVADDYRVAQPGDAITLVNLTDRKGGPLFFDLARRMPDRQFLGVKGAYADQPVPRPLSGNVEIWGNTPDARPIYARTRILLMPSAYESWGRCAIEAAVSGIPTIAHPTPGLTEALRSSGVFKDRDDPDAWVAAIEALDDPVVYRNRSEAAAARAEQLTEQAVHDIDAVHAALLSLLPVPVS